MTFLAPMFLIAGVGAAGAIVLLHLLARRRPRPAVLPTARFVPDRPARWPSRAPRPTDLLLLALRVLAILVIAAAFAQPIRQPARAITTRIALVDRSRAVADERALRDSALTVLREGDVLIAFDTTVRVITAGVRDSATTLVRSTGPSSLSAALIAAERAAVAMRNHADSIELVIVSPFAAETWDPVTSKVRARWIGRVRLVPVPLARGDTTMAAIDVRAPASDGVHAAAVPFTSLAVSRARVVREAPLSADSVWARSSGHVLIHWPRATDSASVTAEAIVAPAVVLVAPLVRYATRAIDDAQVVARFADGAAAVVERPFGDGCIREVGFDLPAVGDVPLRESTRRLLRAVVGAPCESNSARSALDGSRRDSLRGDGRLLVASTLPRPTRQRSPATSWLLIAGALLLMAEVGVRQRMASV